MSMFRAPHHFGITVRSLERSAAFYRDLIGLEEIFHWNPHGEYIGKLIGHPEVDLHAMILRLPNSDVALELLEYRNVDGKPIDSDNGNPGTAHLAFFVDGLDAIYERLKAAGVESVSEPVTPTMGPNEGGRVIYMIDPDGIRVELIQSNKSFQEFS